MTWVAAGQRWHEDSWCCPECGSHLRRDELGWRCGECALSRPSARWVLDGDNVIDSAGTVRELALALPGRANRSNAVMALAVASLFGADVDQALPELRKVVSVAGPVHLGAAARPDAEAAAGQEPGWLARGVRRARRPPGRRCCSRSTRRDRTAGTPPGCGTSTTGCSPGGQVLVTGERKVDLAVRLEADGVPFELVDDVEAAIDAVPPGQLDVIANYTAFQQIRATVGRAV